MKLFGRSSAVVLGVALALGAGAAAAPQTGKTHQPGQRHPVGHDTQQVTGQAVTLTACVEKGQQRGTFVLTHAADVPVHPRTHGRVVYWLNDVKSLGAHVGHQVRIEGTATEVKQEEMELKAGDDGQGGWVVEIEGPGKDVRTTADKVGVATAGREAHTDDIRTTLVKLKVREVTMVAATCPASR